MKVKKKATNRKEWSPKWSNDLFEAGPQTLDRIGGFMVCDIHNIDYLDGNHKMWCLADEKAQDVVLGGDVKTDQ